MKYILAIDQSTSGTKAAHIDERGEIVRKVSRPHRQFYPAPGRVEHDAEEIYQNTLALIDELGLEKVQAVAIANQRETTVLWERGSGRPVCPAVVWQDVRGEGLCRELSAHAETVLRSTGLQLSPYYPAAKLASVLRENPGLMRRAKDGELCAGTIDSYLVYRLTGNHYTDVSNASRTQLMNLASLAWDPALLEIFDIPACLLPEQILPSDADYGTFRGIPVTGVLGDSHASLFGHGCHTPGAVKTSYGTGSSIMMNVGEAPVFSRNGLSASVGFGANGKVCYVLEGNITCSADTLIWLRDELQLVQSLEEIEPLAASVASAQGVCLVPAFSGLGAPYFDSDARAIISGMNRGTTKAHVVRAALESIAQQNADVLDAMRRDTGMPVTRLNADGGGSVNRLLMQLQADLVPCNVAVSAEKDLTALGAGLMAGIAVGLYESYAAVAGLRAPAAEYAPRMEDADRAAMRAAWADAVKKARL